MVLMNLSYQIVLSFGHIGIIRAKPALVDLQSAAVVIFHFLILALVLTEQGQVIELFGHIWMIFPQDLMVRRRFRITLSFLIHYISDVFLFLISMCI